ncbi:MAG: hypothetical protein JWO36_1899 [Myxococcales bacterium]|nr:hypothetical protein [Myxococcales bacterium]
MWRTLPVMLVVSGCAADTVVVSGPHDRYAMTHQGIPASNADARAFGLDLDGDGKLDNQFGMALGAAAGPGYADFQAASDRLLQASQVIALVDLQAANTLGPTADAWTVFLGTKSGATYETDPVSPSTVPLSGSIADKLSTVGPGDLVIPVGLFGTPGRLRLVGAHATFVANNREMHGIIGGGIPATEVMDTILPAGAAMFQQKIASDCEAGAPPPDCGCPMGSPAASMIREFDPDHDCVITVDDLLATSWLNAVLAPDVTIDGQHALSFGISFDATWFETVPAS